MAEGAEKGSNAIKELLLNPEQAQQQAELILNLISEITEGREGTFNIVSDVIQVRVLPCGCWEGKGGRGREGGHLRRLAISSALDAQRVRCAASRNLSPNSPKTPTA